MRGAIFTRARVSLALLSLRKNGDYALSNWGLRETRKIASTYETSVELKMKTI